MCEDGGSRGSGKCECVGCGCRSTPTSFRTPPGQVGCRASLARCREALPTLGRQSCMLDSGYKFECGLTIPQASIPAHKSHLLSKYKQGGCPTPPFLPPLPPPVFHKQGQGPWVSACRGGSLSAGEQPGTSIHLLKWVAAGRGPHQCPFCPLNWREAQLGPHTAL